MSGFCVRVLSRFAAVVLIGAGSSAMAAPKASSIKAVITVAEATVFNQPSFEAEVISNLRGGQIFEISIGKRGLFHRIRVRPGLVGWISEAEVKRVDAEEVREIEAEQKKAASEAYQDPSSKPKRRIVRPLEERRFRGIGLEAIAFKEKTMGKSRQESMLFYGLKFSGPNTIFDGEIETDAEFMFHSGAPSYYEKATGKAAGGFALVSNFLFITSIQQGADLMAFYGFGPSLKLTHFTVGLQNDPVVGEDRSYAMDDLTWGAVFNLGAAYSMGRYAVRVEGRYYWETQSYTSFGLAIQRDF